MNSEKKIDDGGPAFPVTIHETSESGVLDCATTLRDYFAAAALQGLLGSQRAANMKHCEIVNSAWNIAGAMLKARHALNNEVATKGKG